MSVFRERRILLLVLVVLLSGASIGYRYSTGTFPWGLDIVGGSRIALKLEACEATITTTNTDPSFVRDNIVTPIEEELITPVRILGYPAENQVVLEIGRNVSENRLKNILAGEGEVLRIKVKPNIVNPKTHESVIEVLNDRVDMYGTRAVSFRTLGEDLVLFEIPGVEVEEAIQLLGHPGRLEAFVGKTLVYWGTDIEYVYPVAPSEEGYGVTFRVSQKGAEEFQRASAGKEGHPLVFYLDRPDDCLILFSEGLELPTGITFDPNENKFWNGLGSPWESGFYFLVPALKVPSGPLPEDMENELERRRDEEGINRIILLADNFDPTAEWLENVYGENNFKSESVDKLFEICGVEAWPRIVGNLPGEGRRSPAGKAVREPTITTGSRKHARRIRSLLTYTLPVSISFAWKESVSAPLGQAFLSEACNAALAVAVAIGAILYARYRRTLVSGLILVTALFEATAVIGIASAIGLSIGLAEIGGLIAVIGTGVDHQIIITDEVLRGAARVREPMSLKGRVRRAFSVIFAAAATTIAAMLLLFSLGFGAMKGFAIVTILGVLVSVLVTRPAYARMLSILIARGSQTKKV